MSTTTHISNVADAVYLHPVATASSPASTENDGSDALQLHDVMEMDGSNDDTSDNVGADLLHKRTLINKTLDFLNARIDDLKKYLHNAFTLGTIALSHIILDVFFLYWCYVGSVETHESQVFFIRNETGTLLESWVSEKSIVYIWGHVGRRNFFFYVGLCVLSLLFFGLVGIVIWFIVSFNILKRTSKTISTHSTYLLTAVLFQTGTFLLFLFGPSIFILSCWTFEIQGSTNAVNIALIFVCFHGMADMLCTLYFVKPYRTFCLGKVPFFRPKRTIIEPTFITMTIQSRANSY
uniref:7TM GPCR serpentine receptor class x (Srx) domain-containing protein n=1 Tax=Panagrellus redivivus TaxID=6233 RepID=A0A7E4WAQ1_PANRE